MIADAPQTSRIFRILLRAEISLLALNSIFWLAVAFQFNRQRDAPVILAIAALAILFRALFLWAWANRVWGINVIYAIGACLFLLAGGAIVGKVIERIFLWYFGHFIVLHHGSYISLGDASMSYWGLAVLIGAIILRAMGCWWSLFRGRSREAQFERSFIGGIPAIILCYWGAALISVFIPGIGLYAITTYISSYGISISF